MYRFWKELTQPLLTAEGAKVIVEIGSQGGSNTRLLYEYCCTHNAVLHTIDPKPTFDLSDIQTDRDDVLYMYKDLSLNVLPSIHNIDVVLIDGDHNWYTVYNELRTLADQAREDKAPFPMVLFHDVCWPYARRDMYYDPAAIPAEFRHEYAGKGLVPGKKGVSDYGLNSSLDNAVDEGGPKNGVLTAVEDFISGSDESLHFHIIPAFFGYGILVSEQRLACCRELRTSLQDLLPQPNLHRLISKLEDDRTKAFAELTGRKQALAKALEQAEKASSLSRENIQLKENIASKERRLAESEAAVREISEAKSVLERSNAELSEGVTLKDRALAEKEAAVRKLSESKALLERSNSELSKSIALKDEALAKKEAAVISKGRDIQRYREELYGVYRSRSWRYTLLLRKIGSLVRRISAIPHRAGPRAVIKCLYFALPASIRNGQRVENFKNRFKSRETMR